LGDGRISTWVEREKFVKGGWSEKVDRMISL
jgi:hypothetical protein